MFDRGWRQHIEDRQASLETSVNGLRSDVGGVVTALSDHKAILDKIAVGMNDTGEKAAQRAQAVKVEMREETDRRSKTWFAFITAGVALLSAIGIIVAALTGPWKEKLETTSIGQSSDTAAVAAVREVLAQQGAGIGRVQAGLDIQRDNGARRDAELREHDQDIAFMKGVMADRGLPTR